MQAVLVVLLCALTVSALAQGTVSTTVSAGRLTGCFINFTVQNGLAGQVGIEAPLDGPPRTVIKPADLAIGDGPILQIIADGLEEGLLRLAKPDGSTIHIRLDTPSLKREFIECLERLRAR